MATRPHTDAARPDATAERPDVTATPAVSNIDALPGAEPGPSQSSRPAAGAVRGERRDRDPDPLLRAAPPRHPGSAWARLAAWFDDPVEDAASWPPSGGRVLRAHGQRAITTAHRHPGGTNLALAVGLAALSGGRLGHGGGLDWGTGLLTLALSAPLVLRRRYPLGVFAALAAAAAVQWQIAGPMLADAALLIALITVALHRPRRMALLASGVLEVGVVLASVRWYLAGSWIRSLVFLTAMVAATVLGGVNLRARRAHLAAAADRAERSERDREQQARMAAAAERNRIAREMHDVLAHSLAVIVSLADGAAAKLHREPDRAATAIGQIAELGRQSLHDTRHLLDVLRSDEPRELGSQARPQSTLDDLDDLVARMRATGLHATLTRAGTPVRLPAGVGLTAYRITQEALTNTIKHAADAHVVRVELRYEPAQLSIGISDDGHPATAHAAPGAPARSAGHGLAGMRERAAVYHGTIQAGPHPTGGWHVHALLPLTPGGPP